MAQPNGKSVCLRSGQSSQLAVAIPVANGRPITSNGGQKYPMVATMIGGGGLSDWEMIHLYTAPYIGIILESLKFPWHSSANGILLMLMYQVSARS